MGKQKLAMNYPLLLHHISILVFIVYIRRVERSKIKLYYGVLEMQLFSFMVDFKMIMS